MLSLCSSRAPVSWCENRFLTTSSHDTASINRYPGSSGFHLNGRMVISQGTAQRRDYDCCPAVLTVYSPASRSAEIVWQGGTAVLRDHDQVVLAYVTTYSYVRCSELRFWLRHDRSDRFRILSPIGRIGTPPFQNCKTHLRELQVVCRHERGYSSTHGLVGAFALYNLVGT